MTIFLMGSKSEGKNWIYCCILSTKNQKQLIKKWDTSHRKMKKSETLKNGVKTAQKPLFKELRAILEYSDTLAYFRLQNNQILKLFLLHV